MFGQLLQKASRLYIPNAQAVIFSPADYLFLCDQSTCNFHCVAHLLEIVVLDVPPEQGLLRAETRTKRQNNERRFEDKGLSFHKSVRDGFIKLAKNEPDRFVIVDARGTAEETDQLVRKHIFKWLQEQGAFNLQKLDL